MRITKIDRSVYRKTTQEALSLFADNVGTKCNTKEYDILQPEAANVKVAADDYRVALQDAQSGDKQKIAIKKEKKAILLTFLDVLATNIEWKSDGSEAFVLGTGFGLRATTTTSNRNADLDIPNISRANSTGMRGELAMLIDMPKKSGFSQLGFEYSTDQGETWHNGTYSSSNKFTWKQLPPAAELKVRARAIGTYNRKSEWSEVVIAAVL
jgi:hypothetical protein